MHDMKVTILIKKWCFPEICYNHINTNNYNRDKFEPQEKF